MTKKKKTRKKGSSGERGGWRRTTRKKGWGGGGGIGRRNLWIENRPSIYGRSSQVKRVLTKFYSVSASGNLRSSSYTEEKYGNPPWHPYNLKITTFYKKWKPKRTDPRPFVSMIRHHRHLTRKMQPTASIFLLISVFQVQVLNNEMGEAVMPSLFLAFLTQHSLTCPCASSHVNVTSQKVISKKN